MANMRIQTVLVIEMTEEQVDRWADDNGLERAESGKVMAKTVVEDVRTYLQTYVQGSELGEYSDVTIKR